MIVKIGIALSRVDFNTYKYCKYHYSMSKKEGDVVNTFTIILIIINIKIVRWKVE